MEVLGALSAPPVLQIAYTYLTIAWQQYSVVQGHKEQCALLVNRCQDLLVEVCTMVERDGCTPEMQSSVLVLENACLCVKDTISHVSGKGFAWRLLNQDKMVQSIALAESSISDAFACFNLGAHLSSQKLQLDIEGARQQDHSELISQLDGLAENDQKILSALQADQRGRHRLEELVIALTKHVRNLSPTDGSADPTEKFIRTASATLQRLSNNPSPDIPHWSVTSLEVGFDPNDDTSCIGRGGFGNIYKGEWNGLVVAVKEMYSEDARMLDRQNLKAILHEIKIWSRLTHPHVLPFYCACLEATKPFMVSRYCPNGNALEFLRRFPQSQKIPMLHEISLGMVYLHSQSVIHSDLKASNILIGDDGKALIADFGLSFLQEQASTGATRTMASSSQRLNGTLRWMAPELIDGEKLDKPADVYSFALLVWELYTGQVPYGNIPDRAFARRVVDKQERPGRPDNLDVEALWALIQRCWNAEPAERPVFTVIQAKLRQLRGSLRGVEASSTPTSPNSGSTLSAGSFISQTTAVNSPSSLRSPMSPISGKKSLSGLSATSVDVIDKTQSAEQHFQPVAIASPSISSSIPPSSVDITPPMDVRAGQDTSLRVTDSLPVRSPSPSLPAVEVHPPAISQNQDEVPSALATSMTRERSSSPTDTPEIEVIAPTTFGGRQKLIRVPPPLPSTSDAEGSETSMPSNTSSPPFRERLDFISSATTTIPTLPDLQHFPTLQQLVASERASLVPAFKAESLEPPPLPVHRRAASQEHMLSPASRDRGSPSPSSMAEYEVPSRRISDPAIDAPSSSFIRRLSVDAPTLGGRRRGGRPTPICPPPPTADLSPPKKSPMSAMHKRFGSLVKDALPKATRPAEKQEPLEHAGYVSSLVPSPDKSKPDPRKIRRLQYYLMPSAPPDGTICLTSVAISENWIVAGISNGSVLFFDAKTGQLKGNLTHPPCKDVLVQLVSNPEFDSPVSKKLDKATLRTIDNANPKEVAVTGGLDGSLRIWNLDTGKMIHQVEGHEGPILCMEKHEQFVYTGSQDESIRVWDIRFPFHPSGPTHVLDRHTRPVTCLSSMHGNKFASGSVDTTVRLWRIDANQHQALVCTFRGHEAPVTHVAFSGSRIVSAAEDSTLRIWSESTSDHIATVVIDSPVTCLYVTPIFVYVGAEDGTVRKQSLFPPTRIISSLAIAPPPSKEQPIAMCDTAIRSLLLVRDCIIAAGDSGPVKAYSQSKKTFEPEPGAVDESTINIPSTPSSPGSVSLKWRFARGCDRWVFVRQYGSRHVLDIWG